MRTFPLGNQALKEDEATDQQAIRPQSNHWSLDLLMEACRRKGIDVEETNDFKCLQGIVVQCGETTLISIRASLTPAEKRFTLAHELAHLALGQLQATPTRFRWERQGEQGTPLPFAHDREREIEADIWAAHALMRPEVFERHLQAAKAIWADNDDAKREAIVQTAAELDLPHRVVHIWLSHHNHHFKELPDIWLRHP